MRCLAWAIDIVDDFADTEIDEEVTQVMLSGGIYVAPADVAALCDGCLSRLLGEQQPGVTRPGRDVSLPAVSASAAGPCPAAGGGPDAAPNGVAA